MANTILDEIWRVRAELVKKHGGIHGYLDHIQKLDQARIRKERRRRSSKIRQTTVKTRVK